MHRHKETMNTGKIILGLKINLILFHVGAAALCTISISQTSLLEVDHTNKNVTMQCSFTTSGCPSEQPTSLWFRYGAQNTENLCVHGCGSDKFTESRHLAENQVSLTVNDLQVNDSAIYICGLAFPISGDPRAKQTGNGTLLVVRVSKGNKVQILLIVVLALLSIYIVGLGVVFIVLCKTKSSDQRKKVTEDSQKKKSARRVFQEIAQELYNKRHMETRHPPEKEDTYENRSALCKYERP